MKKSRLITTPLVFNLILPLLFAVPTMAATGDVKDFSIHQQFVSPRALGMGNAFIAVSDDISAVLYNPAGLVRIPEPQINLSLIQAGIDSKYPQFVGDIDAAAKSNDVARMTSFLESNYGNHFSARISPLNVFWARPRWGVAIIPMDLNLEMRVAQTIGPQLQVVAHADTTVAYARAWKVHHSGGKTSLGATAKAIYRGYLNKSVSAIELAFDSNILKTEDAAEGLALDADIGLLHSPDVPSSGFFSFLEYMRPTFGLVVRNVGDYGYIANFHAIEKSSIEPDRLQRRFDVGSMYELPDWWIWKTRFALDVRDIGHENWTFRKGLHMGAEFLWKIRSWWQGGWRIGVNQGYFTAGFNGDFAMFRLDVVTYAQEVGTSETPKATRIYMAKASLDF